MMIVSDAAVSTAEKKEVAGRKHLCMSRAYGVTRGRMKGVAMPAAFWQRPEQGKNIFSIRRKTMRKFAKIVAVLLALGFVASCGAKKKVVTKWSMTINGESSYLTFYNDGTVESSNSDNDEVATSPYTGDTKKDGVVTVGDESEKIPCIISGDELLFAGILTYTKVKK